MSVGRRTLMRILAGAAAGSPLLAGLVSRVGRAEADAPLRFVVLFTGNGDLPEQWLPTGGETDFTLSPVLTPLAAHRARALFVRGLFSEAHDHVGGLSEALTGRPAGLGSQVASAGPSLDQALADRWRAQAPLASLELGVWPSNQPTDQVCYSASGLPVPAIGSPGAAFARIAGTADGDATLARTEQQSRVLELLARRTERVASELGEGAGPLLEEHLRIIERRRRELAEAPVVTCDAPLAPVEGGFVDTWRAQLDNIVTALRCDVTRVVTLRAGGAGGIEAGGYGEVGVAGEHHAAAHGASDDPAADLLAIGRFHSAQLAYLLDGLAAIPEADGTLLDSTVVVWLRELGLGQFNHHSRVDVHAVIAGGACAGLAQGRSLDLRGGAHYHDLLLSLAFALGDTDRREFGDHGRRVLERLFA